MENTKKVISYCRVSSDEQRDFGFSIENQKQRAIAYCTYKGFNEPTFLSDEGISGRKMANRPALQQIMKMIKNNEVERIIIYSLSRLSRDTVETMLFIRELNKQEIPLHSLTEELNTSTAVGRFYLLMSAGLAELESDQIGERTASVLQNKKANLEPYSNTPYGFTTEGRIKDQEGKIIKAGYLKPLEEESKVVQLIFSRNTYPSEIQNFLNSQNIKPKKADKWSRQAIVKILNNKKLYETAGVINTDLAHVS